jgi:hypothetical protein
MLTASGPTRVLVPLFSHGKYRYDPSKDNGVLSVEEAFNTSKNSPVVRIVLRLSKPAAVAAGAASASWCGGHWPHDITTALGRVGASASLALAQVTHAWGVAGDGVGPTCPPISGVHPPPIHFPSFLIVLNCFFIISTVYFCFLHSRAKTVISFYFFGRG